MGEARMVGRQPMVSIDMMLRWKMVKLLGKERFMLCEFRLLSFWLTTILVANHKKMSFLMPNQTERKAKKTSEKFITRIIPKNLFFTKMEKHSKLLDQIGDYMDHLTPP